MGKSKSIDPLAGEEPESFDEPEVPDIGGLAFVQASPNQPVPAAAGPAANYTPVSPLVSVEPVQSKLIPAAPLPPYVAPPPPPPSPA